MFFTVRLSVSFAIGSQTIKRLIYVAYGMLMILLALALVLISTVDADYIAYEENLICVSNLRYPAALYVYTICDVLENLLLMFLFFFPIFKTLNNPDIKNNKKDQTPNSEKYSSLKFQMKLCVATMMSSLFALAFVSIEIIIGLYSYAGGVLSVDGLLNCICLTLSTAKIWKISKCESSDKE